MKAKQLFWEFSSIGMWSFGGGYSLVALAERCFVHQHRVLSSQRFWDLITLASMSPGALGVNVSYLLGRELYQEKKGGGILCIVAFVWPSLLMIIFLAFSLSWIESSYLLLFLRGILPAALALMVQSFFNLAQKRLSGLVAVLSFLWSFLLFLYLGTVLGLFISLAVLTLFLLMPPIRAFFVRTLPEEDL